MFNSYIIYAIFAAAAAILICIAMGPFMIPFLTRLKVGQNIREEGPQSHLVKAGTPTMGGIIIITAVMVASFLFAGKSERVLTAVLVMLAFGGIGFWDDYIKVVLKRSLGLRAREKVILQLITAAAFAFFLVFYLNRGTTIMIPFSGAEFDLGWWYIPFIILVVIGTANAVNLTDGLDGLVSGVTFFVAVALGLLAYLTQNANLTIFCGALAGACIGFLIFNHYPARVFMGDTGSMAIGGAIAAVAAMTGTEIALVLLGGVYVLEALSVMIQVASFQTTGKRVFLMSPLHHHFELKGWKETRVVYFFWFLSFVFVLLGLWGCMII